MGIGKYLPWVTAIAMFIQNLDGTILNTSLPVIARDMGYSPLEMQSVIVSYTLTLALFIPISGWLADRFGTRKMFILSVFIFVLGSLFCALSVNLFSLNLSRIIQAIGGSMMVPIARLTILYEFPRSQLLRVMNFITVFGLMGQVVGPSLGGFLSDNISWHWIFLVNLPVGIIGILLAMKVMPNYRHPVGRFDFIGLLYISLALVSLTLIMELANVGFNHWTLILGLFLLTGILFVLYYRHFRRSASPIINLGLMRIRTLRVGLVGSLLTRLGIGGLPLLLPLLMQAGFGYSASISGLMLIPSALANVAIKPFITRIIKTFGYRSVLISNTTMLGLVILALGFLTKETPLPYYVALMVLYGGLTSVQMSAMNTITLNDLDENTASGGNTMLVIAQQLSVSFGVSVSGLILSVFKSGRLTGTIDNVNAFHYTFITLAIMTVLSSLVFSKLRPTDGNKID